MLELPHISGRLKVTILKISVIFKIQLITVKIERKIILLLIVVFTL